MAILTTRGDLREYFNSVLAQPGAFADSAVNTMLNVAYKRFIAKSECLEDVRSVSSMANIGLYELPGSLIKIKDAYFRGDLLSAHNLRGILMDNMERRQPNTLNASGKDIKKYYTRNYGNKMFFGLYGIPSDGASSTTISANGLLTAGTISLNSATGFEYTGAFAVTATIGATTEVVHYMATSGNDCVSCLRGREDTAAQAVSIGDAVVERDIFMVAVPNPADMDDDADEPLCDESYRECIVKYALSQAYLSLKMWEQRGAIKKEFDDDCINIKGMFDTKKTGLNQRRRPFIEKYA